MVRREGGENLEKIRERSWKFDSSIAMALWTFFFAIFSPHCLGLDCVFFGRLVGWVVIKVGRRKGRYTL